MMVGMAAVQVLVVRFFFQGARKGKHSPIFHNTAADSIRLCINLDLYMNRADMAETKIMTRLCGRPFRYVACFDTALHDFRIQHLALLLNTQRVPTEARTRPLITTISLNNEFRKDAPGNIRVGQHLSEIGTSGKRLTHTASEAGYQQHRHGRSIFIYLYQTADCVKYYWLILK